MDWVGQLILTYYPMMQTMFQGHQSCGSSKEGLKGIHYLKIVCEHDLEIPQSQTARQTHGTARKRHTTIKRHQEDKLIHPWIIVATAWDRNV